jgi:hypothetical protein
MSKICKFFLEGNCKFGDQCKFSHTEQNNNVKKDKPKKNKDKYKNKKIKLKKVNTETFEPWYDPADMRIMFGNPCAKNYNHVIESRDVIMVPNLFENDGNLYDKLLEEVKSSGAEEKGLWKEWHGDSHLIADDHIQWKSKCPSFSMVIDKLKEYFNMDIKATRLNWYKDSTNFKPFHFDAAAIDPEKAKTQNFTAAVSFGLTRDAEFEHAKTKTRIKLPQENGMIYCFAKDTNIEWRHGITPMPKDVLIEKGRISIIAWGTVQQTESK